MIAVSSLTSGDPRFDRWNRVAKLLEQAAALNESLRQAFLEQHESDPELRAEVVALLAHSNGAGDFLEQPLSLELNDPLGGTQAGNCRLEKLLGEGGMGSVYEAVRTLDVPGVAAQSLPVQRVAVKICHSGQFEPEVFRREAAALARLDHPGIARLYDTGHLSDGRPFLVIELVEGRPIHEYIAGKTEKEKMALVAQVCQAVGAAHEAGLVHRDIKPSNILVTPTGVAKLIDFGISKQVDDRDLTANVRLTPRYASPEQFLRQPTTAAVDIYSLGVLMYELFTGANPFGGKTGPALIAAVCEHPALVPALSQDLASIVLKAMARDPRDRYISARALAEDLEHYRKGEPVSAVQAGAGYRARKFIVRRRVPLATAAGALLLVGIGFGRAYSERRESNRRFAQTHALAHSLLFEVHDEVKKVPGTLESRKVIIAQAKKYLDELSLAQPTDKTLLLDLSDSLIRMGSLQGSVGSGAESLHDWDASRASFETSLAILERLNAQSPGDRDLRTRLAKNYQLISDACIQSAQPKCQEQRSQQALAAFESIARETSEDASAQVQWLTARMKHKVQPLYRDRELAPALEELQSIATAFEEVAKRHPEADKLGARMAAVYKNLGSVEGLMGHYDSMPSWYTRVQDHHHSATSGDTNAREHYERAISWYTKARGIYWQLKDADTAIETENNLGWVLKHQGKLAEANTVLDRVVDFRREAARNRGQDKKTKRDLVYALHGRASVLYKRKRWGQLRSDAQEALAILDAFDRELPDETIRRGLTLTYSLLGDSNWELNDKEAARAAYRKFLARVPPKLPPDSNYDQEGVDRARRRTGQAKP